MRCARDAQTRVVAQVMDVVDMVRGLTESSSRAGADAVDHAATVAMSGPTTTSA
ncbi:MAG: hypothetical protein ACTHLJ_04395 [Angustibacter sp.]